MREIKIGSARNSKIKIGERIFEVDTSYRAVKALRENTEVAALGWESIGTDHEISDDELTDLFRTAINGILVGAPFDEIFNMCEWDLFTVLEVLMEIAETIGERMSRITKAAR